jgi:hypothetical protein
MRRYAGALIVVAIFAVLLLVVLLTQNNSSTTTPTPAAAASPTVTNTADLQILSLGSDPITGLEIRTVTSTATFKLDAGTWKQTAPNAQTLDTGIISETVRQLGNLRGDSAVPDQSAGNLATFGLDKPSLSVTLTTAANASKVLNVGLRNPATGSYYVKLADSPKVWALNSFFPDTFNTWLKTPPTPAPSVAPVGVPQTPLPSVTPTATPAPPTTTPAVTTAASTTVTGTTPAATTPTVSAMTPASTTTAPPTTTQ